MTTTINKLEKIGKYFMKELKLYYIENNEEYFINEVTNYYIDHKLYTDCELQTKRNLIAFIQNENEDDDLPNMVKYYLNKNGDKFNIEVAKYCVKIFEEFTNFLKKYVSQNETSKKMCKEFLKEEFVKCLKLLYSFI